jgi:two-component system, OmpR family, aerobic respiration control sensor histidine kinase ArcB
VIRNILLTAFFIGVGMNIRNQSHTIISKSPGNVYWKDREGHYLGCNQMVANILGLPIAEIIGKTDRELLKGKLSQKEIQAIEKVDQDVMQIGKEKTIEEVGIDKQGNPSYYITTKMPLYNEKKEIIGVIGTSIDITKSKLTEIRDNIIAQVPYNLYWKDIKGNYLGCNETFAKLLKLEKPEEIVGKNDYDFFLRT